MVRGSLLVFFDDPFWVAIVEREGPEGQREVGRIVFGAEPTHAQLLEWVQTHYKRVTTVPVCGESSAADALPRLASTQRRNPKRAKREAARALEPISATRAQEAVKEAYAARKAEAPSSRPERDLDAERKWALRVQKRKQKHRGH